MAMLEFYPNGGFFTTYTGQYYWGSWSFVLLESVLESYDWSLWSSVQYDELVAYFVTVGNSNMYQQKEYVVFADMVIRVANCRGYSVRIAVIQEGQAIEMPPEEETFILAPNAAFLLPVLLNFRIVARAMKPNKEGPLFVSEVFNIAGVSTSSL